MEELETTTAAPQGPTKFAEQWAKEKLGKETWWLDGARAHAKWGPDQLVSEAEFDAAVEAAKNIKLG